jgi:hypothetical protein
MLKKLSALFVVIGLITLIGLTTGCSAEEKAKEKDKEKDKTKALTKGMSVRREIVNVSVKRPSHVIVKPGATFTTAATVTATYSGTTSGGGTVTSTFTGKVRKVEADGKLIIRLNCTDTKKEKAKDTASGDLTVTVSEGGATDNTTVANVLGDDDLDACP